MCVNDVINPISDVESSRTYNILFHNEPEFKCRTRTELNNENKNTMKMNISIYILVHISLSSKKF